MFRNISISFIESNAKGMQSCRNRLKLIHYFKEKIGPSEILFLQENHSSTKVEQNGKSALKVVFSFPMAK